MAQTDSVTLVQSSWAMLTDDGNKDRLTAIGMALVNSLFEQHPKLLKLFPFKDETGQPKQEKMEAHALKVASAVTDMVSMLNDMPKLQSYVERLVQRHIKYGVLLEHYDVVLGLLAGLLSSALTAKGMWDDAMSSAWVGVVTAVKQVAANTYSAAEGSAMRSREN